MGVCAAVSYECISRNRPYFVSTSPHVCMLICVTLLRLEMKCRRSSHALGRDA